MSRPDPNRIGYYRAEQEDWEEFVEEFRTATGLDYSVENLSDPNWCVKELARLGFSILLRHETPQRYLEKVRENGKNPEKEFFKNNHAQIASWGGFYTYRLMGGFEGSRHRYTEKDSHGSPILPTLESAVSTALMNVCRLHKEGEL